MKKTIRLGYTAGTFDLVHVGHLRFLTHAKQHCDRLIVGVNSDELVSSYKGKIPVIAAEQRLELIQAFKVVDDAEIVHTLDKLAAWDKHHFSVVFIGDDWRGSERWNQTEVDLERVGARVTYLPYTEGISSTYVFSKIQRIGS